MNFDTMTTDELIELMPPNENGWEYKGACLLEKANRNDLLKELEKQTSAFANSGGGYLIFGVNKDDLSFQSCQLNEGSGKGEPMEEWLAKRIQMSVDYPLIGAKVYRIYFTHDPAKAVFLVEYPDSPKSPHQAKTDKKYYWRTNFASEPAPHFFLDALRSRPSKAILELSLNDFVLSARNEITKSTTIQIMLSVCIINTSCVSTDKWCVHAKCEESDVHWKSLNNGEIETSWRQSAVLDNSLLPGEKRVLHLSSGTSIDSRDWQQWSPEDKYNAYAQFNVSVKPASHNFVGDTVTFNVGQHEETATKAKLQLREMRIK